MMIFSSGRGNIKSQTAALSIDHQRWASLVEQLVEGGLELPEESDLTLETKGWSIEEK
jgi:hypothetical protein